MGGATAATIPDMDATDWAQIASAVFTAVAAAAALLTVRRAEQQNETARESIAAQHQYAERAESLARKPVLAVIDDPDGDAGELRHVGRGRRSTCLSLNAIRAKAHG